jgi:hypothetical protein
VSGVSVTRIVTQTQPRRLSPTLSSHKTLTRSITAAAYGATQALGRRALLGADAVRSEDYGQSMASSSSAASQGLAVTILPNGHNGTIAHTGAYTPAAYHQSATAMLAATILLLAALAFLTQALSYHRRRESVSRTARRVRR